MADLQTGPFNASFILGVVASSYPVERLTLASSALELKLPVVHVPKLRVSGDWGQMKASVLTLYKGSDGC